MADCQAAQQLVKFELASEYTRIKKRSLPTKEGKVDKESKVIGYFKFALTASSELLEIGYLGGFGKYNVIGCRCCEVVNDS